MDEEGGTAAATRRKASACVRAWHAREITAERAVRGSVLTAWAALSSFSSGLLRLAMTSIDDDLVLARGVATHARARTQQS